MADTPAPIQANITPENLESRARAPHRFFNIFGNTEDIPEHYWV